MLDKISPTRFLLVATAMLLLFTATSKADTVTFTTNTTGAPTFNRPLVSGGGLSTVGTAVRYAVVPFTVSLGGTYTFNTTAVTPLYEPFNIVYRNSFNPATPLVNFVAANDGSPTPFSDAIFSTTLMSGTNYFFVVTGFNNADFGLANNNITGPGIITIGNQPGAIPEPATMILLGTGLAGVLAKVRRRKTEE